MKPYTIIAETRSEHGEPRGLDVMVIYAPTLVIARQRYADVIKPLKVGRFREVRPATEAEIMLWNRLTGIDVKL